MANFTNLRQFISALRYANEIVDIEVEVDSDLEIAEIHRRVVAADGPALFFHRVKGSSFPVVTNLFGSKKRVDLAFGREPQEFIETVVKMLKTEFPPSLRQLWNERNHLKRLFKMGMRRERNMPLLESLMEQPDLEKLPLLKLWEEDGGHFVTLPLVYTEPPGGGPPNLGMYRIQRYDKNTTGLHFQIGKGGGNHYYLAEEKNVPLPVHIFIGGAPALLLSAIAPLPENVPELIFASLLQGSKLGTKKEESTGYPLIGECEFALVGHANPQERRPEGPFGDHYGYYSLTHDFPVFHCKKIYHRKDAIYPATVVGKPRQEDFYIGDYLQELLSPLFPVVMPSIKALWSYGETGFHSLAAAIIKERFYRESMVSAFRILGEGQLSLTKFLLLTDQPVELKNFKVTLETVLERFRPEKDLFVFSELSLDTLDYTGPSLNKGSRGVMLGIGPAVRVLQEKFAGTVPGSVRALGSFCRGCLVIEIPPYTEFQDLQSLCRHEDFSEWPLIIAVDSLAKTVSSEISFLWTVFTRFSPGEDLYSADLKIKNHHLIYSGPILIDARMKPTYPKEVLCDDKTHSLVSKRWKEYFPLGMEMGDSQEGHIK